ncbi:hypothetical protein SB748_35150, partial [Rhizobium sp. SIMBA_035]
MAKAKTQQKNGSKPKANKKLVTLPEIFTGAGFTPIETDGIHFEVAGRTREIDFIFSYKNVVV